MFEDCPLAVVFRSCSWLSNRMPWLRNALNEKHSNGEDNSSARTKPRNSEQGPCTFTTRTRMQIDVPLYITSDHLNITTCLSRANKMLPVHAPAAKRIGCSGIRSKRPDTPFTICQFREAQVTASTAPRASTSVAAI